ncbi:hypothetical protein [Sulfurimonas sp.]|uniref:hypothetical protein n=1 Tax=Sulfurimonas sp. TaxID=2022749 RepID=UPI0025E09546|nr:hypothetical protein [Sulfurimonas sp.]
MKLEKPGAGLPNIERLFIKNILVPAVRIFFTWDIALYLLKREVRLISKLVSSVDKQSLQEQMIIDRVFAIEDDSRRYSVNMVLEHLNITGLGIMKVISTLSKEEEMKQDITIESVKAYENAQNSIISFTKFMKTYESFINKLPKKHSSMTKKHPWFVEFNNFEWSAFMFMHTFIHRRQIEAIISKLKEKKIQL